MSSSSIFELDEFKPYEAPWNVRQAELARRERYYDGSIYRKVRENLGWLGPRLYKGVKPLYLPLARAVDVDAGIVPGGWKLSDDAAASWAPALKTLFAWSSWETDGVLFVHYGAMYGCSGLKVADLRDQARVVLKPINPSCFLLVPGAQYDSTPSLALWIEQREGKDGPYEYAEVITSSDVRTFAAGQPIGVDGRPPEYPNDLGFVPFVEARHIETGKLLGECTYQKAIPLLDEVNELASYLADIIKKHAEPQWAIAGAEASDLVRSGDNVWFLPGESKATPMVAGIDIPGVLEFIREIRDQVHGALPELAFQELVSKTQIATATLELQLMELVIKVHRCRPNYDHGLADGVRMAGRAADSMSIRDLAALDDEHLGFDAERPVLPLDKETQMRLELMAIQLEREQQMDAGGVVPHV
jgi:hypothetical protein